MVLLDDAVEKKKWDVRTLEKNIERGLMTQDELEKELKKLPDDSANVEFVDLEKLEQEGQSRSNGLAEHIQH